MPENAYRRSHLHQHYASTFTRSPELTRALWLHPEWPICTAGCRWPVDPAGADPNQPDQHLNQPCGGPGAVHGDRQRTTGA